MAYRKRFDNASLIKEIKAGNMEARENFINFYIPISKKIASEYFGLGVSEEDIISYAYLGLMEAIYLIENKDYVNVSIVIYRKIRKVIEENIVLYYGININSSTILFSNILEFLKAKRDLKIELKRNPTIREVANYIGCDLEDIIYVKSFFNNSSIMYEDVYSVRNSLDLEMDYLDKETLLELSNLVNKYLSPREIEILYLRNCEKLKLREIGEIYGVSRERVNSLEIKAKEKIKNIRIALENGDYSYLKFLDFDLMPLIDVVIKSKEGDADALDYVMNHYDDLVKKLASEYFDLGIDNDKVLEVSYEGLKDAIGYVRKTSRFEVKNLVRSYIERYFLYYYAFTPAQVYKFWTLKKELKKVLFRVESARVSLVYEKGCEPSSIEISEYINENIEKVEEVNRLLKIGV